MESRGATSLFKTCKRDYWAVEEVLGIGKMFSLGAGETAAAGSLVDP